MGAAVVGGDMVAGRRAGSRSRRSATWPGRAPVTRRGRGRATWWCSPAGWAGRRPGWPCSRAGSARRGRWWTRTAGPSRRTGRVRRRGRARRDRDVRRQRRPGRRPAAHRVASGVGSSWTVPAHVPAKLPTSAGRWASSRWTGCSRAARTTRWPPRSRAGAAAGALDGDRPGRPAAGAWSSTAAPYERPRRLGPLRPQRGGGGCRSAPRADHRRLGLRRRRRHPGRPQDDARPRRARDERADRGDRAELAGRQGYWELPVEAVRAQLDSVLGDIGVDAVKTGMLASDRAGHGCGRGARPASGVPVVVDPVGVSKHGDALLAADAVAALRNRLLPVATLVTPNLDEVGRSPAQVRSEPTCGPRPRRARPRAGRVLVKGGHLDGRPVDLLLTAAGEERTYRAAAAGQPAHPRHRLHAGQRSPPGWRWATRCPTRRRRPRRTSPGHWAGFPSAPESARWITAGAGGERP